MLRVPCAVVIVENPEGGILLYMKALANSTVLKLFILGFTSAGFSFVPDSMIPRPIWPLATGLLFLGIVAANSAPTRQLRDDDLAPALGGILFTILGIILIIDRDQYLAGMLLGLAVVLLAGWVWAGWKARREG